MDEIRIENLIVFGNHGVFEEENTLGQKFSVSAVLYVDARKAGMDDDLQQSVHYGEVCKEINRYMKEHTFNLIEAAAEHLAAHLLMKFEKVRRLDLEVRKPWAPIGLPLDTVSVKISRGWHRAFIALGSNMGNKAAYLGQGIESVNATGGCRVVNVSDFIVTQPYGGVDQDEFLNGCMEVETLLEPEELLMVLNKIEAEAERTRDVHWGPRTLDLDILFYDDLVYGSKNLLIPHVDIKNRAFVLKPMAQIAPYHMHPVYHKTMLQMLEELEG